VIQLIGFHSVLPTLLRAGVTCAALSTLYIQPYRTMVFVGSSMEPTYRGGSVALTEPVQEDALQHGMVVVINMDGGPIVKRIAFLPGDTITQVKVGTEWLDMIYLHAADEKSTRNMKVRNFIVPPGRAYVLGDNQMVSQDSKAFGCVDTSRIERKLIDQRPFDILCVNGCPKSWIQ